MTVYLDHAATTSLRPEAREAWLEAQQTLGNPSSIHAAGQAARRALEDARERIAAALECDPIEVILTSGGTESVNLALQGLWQARPRGADTIVLPHGEHHATLDTVEALHDRSGARVADVPLDGAGRIPPGAFRSVLETEGDAAALATALVANNEIGTVNDAALLAEHAARTGVPLHLDAIAAVGHVPVAFRSWRGPAPGRGGLVALSVSGHKVGAPVGTGALIVSREAELVPLIHGGGQQRGLRSGTQDAAGAAALAVAIEAAVAEREAEAVRLSGLRERLIRGVQDRIDEAELLGDGEVRLPGNAHFLFPGASGDAMLFLLDREGIAASTGSACQAGVPEPSHVVLALGRTEREARQVLRFTLGRTSTRADVDALLAVLPEVYARARRT